MIRRGSCTNRSSSSHLYLIGSCHVMPFRIIGPGPPAPIRDAVMPHMTCWSAGQLLRLSSVRTKRVFLNEEHGEFYSEPINSLDSELKASNNFTKLCNPWIYFLTPGKNWLGYFLGHAHPRSRRLKLIRSTL